VLNGRRVLVVVPARGGSKGVKLKNIHPLLGQPLIAHVGAVVRQLPYVDKAVVSTDHPAIAEAARGAGLEVPFLRPEALSGDLIGDVEVLTHALTEMERIAGVTLDVVVMLQPTSPLRTPAHVTAVVTKLVDEGWDAVWTLSRTDVKYHPLKALTLAGDGRMDYYDRRGATIIARQQLDASFHRNGAAYAFTRTCLLDHKTIKPARTAGVVVDEPMVSIDTLEDFDRVERVLRQRGRGERTPA
jgi:CMP-N,N'-diacetyllegionaminic acid synthase